MLNEKTPLLDALQQMAAKPHSAFYAPGHKQGRGCLPRFKHLLEKYTLAADLPELPELDNLFAPEGAIALAQELAAQTFGAKQTWFLVNGSTCGIVASILAVCGTGDKIILPRNIHQSAIAGLILSGAIPIFINPEYDSAEGLAYNVSVESVRQALTEHPDVKAVMMLHPTYQGVCADLAAIAQLTHQYDIPLIVDEAHGAHFAFHPNLPPSALSVGADLTVQSTHKVLSAMTQASMLHLQGDRISASRINQALQLVESTSPNYLLLASLDAARQQMAIAGRKLMGQTLNLAKEARRQLQTVPNIAILHPSQSPGCHDLDLTRLTLNLSPLGITGFKADEILHEQLAVTCELPLLNHLSFIISLGNTSADIQQLINAISNLSLFHQSPTSQLPHFSTSSLPHSPTPLISPRQAYFADTQTIPLEQASDRRCGELICP